MQQQPRLPLWFLLANWALIGVAFALGVVLGGKRHADLPDPQATALELVHAEILRSHVEPQDARELLDRAIGAMVGGLDDYSLYVPPSNVAHYEEQSTGRYEGIGVVIQQHGEDVVVYYPFPGGPAERAGLRPGDRLLAVDGQSLTALPTAERQQRARELVRGPADTTLRLRLARDGGELEVEVQRGGVQRSVVKWAHRADPEQGLGYVHVTDFDRGVTRDLEQAITALQAAGPLRGLILDLRGNGGGNFDESIAMARLFLRDGAIVSTRRRDSELLELFAARADLCRHPDLPLVLLVDERSASASEVVAGALQDHGRAALVGVRTHGKGVVNTVYTWRDQPFRLKLTTARYYTPKGRNIDRPHRRPAASPHANGGGDGEAAAAGGIAPDVEVAVDEATRRAIHAALDELEVPQTYREACRALATRYGSAIAEPPQPGRDPQLQQALVALRARLQPPEHR